MDGAKLEHAPIVPVIEEAHGTLQRVRALHLEVITEDPLALAIVACRLGHRFHFSAGITRDLDHVCLPS